MSERLEARSEVLKLARVLSVTEDEVAFMERLPAAELRQFREQVTDRMFDSSSKLLDRVAAGAKLIPSGVIATIAQRAFGPLLCARAAGAVDTAKAIDVAGRLPPEFLADTAVELDPRRVAPIIGTVPASLVVPVARELGDRREYVTMGRFLAFVTDDAIIGAIGALDDEALLRTAFVLEHKERLDHAIGLLPPDRVPDVLRQATALDLWPEALDLLDHLSDERRGRIADTVAELGDTVIAGIVTAVDAAGIWDSLLPVVGMMSDGARLKLAAAPVFHEPEVMTSVIRSAARQGLWVELVPLIDALPVAALDVLVASIDEADRQVAEDLLASVADPREAAPLFETLPPAVSQAVERAAARFGMEDVLAQALGE